MEAEGCPGCGYPLSSSGNHSETYSVTRVPTWKRCTGSEIPRFSTASSIRLLSPLMATPAFGCLDGLRHPEDPPAFVRVAARQPGTMSIEGQHHIVRMRGGLDRRRALDEVAGHCSLL